MELGKKIQMLRQESHMSQDKLAERIHVSRQAISKWEKGAAMPDTDNIVQLSKFFQVPIEYLLLDEYDSVDQIKSDKGGEKQPYTATGKKKGFLIILGVILEVITVCLAYVMQYAEWAIKGECFTYPLDYLRFLPLNLIVGIGVICIIVGVVRIVKEHLDKYDQ